MPCRCISTCTCHTPCGELLLGSFGGRLCLCDWQEGCHHQRTVMLLQRALNAPLETADSPILQQARHELEAFFAGERCPWNSPLLLIGTDFQKRIWQQLHKIPFGSTISYGDFAHQLGIPRATRAIARAISANTLSLYVPCHRVTGSRGHLGGYRGGLRAKQFLLQHERTLLL